MKGLTIITEVLFLAIVLSLIFVVYGIAAPSIYGMQASVTFDQMKSGMLELDGMIQEVAGEGEGSRRTVYMEMRSGTLELNETTDSITWEMETSSQILSPRSYQRIGNLIYGSDLGVSVYESSYGGSDTYTMENEALVIHMLRNGTNTSRVWLNSTELLRGIYSKQLGEWMPLDRMEISVNQTEGSLEGPGYTEAAEESYHISRGEIDAYFASGQDEFRIRFILESGADFLIIRGEDISNI